MTRRTAIIAIAIATGAALELGVQIVSGRREAWDSALYWTFGLPGAALVALIIGILSPKREWIFAFLIAPAQVATMMVRNAQVGNLWPLAIVLSAVVGAPFLAVAFVGSLIRRLIRR
jgi:hypothetical protein